MRYLLLLAALWMLAQPVEAAPLPPDTATLHIIRLPATGLLLAHGWRYHAGDDPAWARPDFDDSRWDTLNPARPRREQPRAVHVGISWLRLRFRLGDSLRVHDLLVYSQEIGAVEVYLNGKLVQRQGVITADPTRVQPSGRFLQPGAVPASGPAEQVLAVRYAPWRPLLPGGLDRWPQVGVRLFAPQSFWEDRARQRDNELVFLVLLGFSGLLAFLHFAFFYYNPSQPANRYFGLFALSAVFTSLLAYFGRTLVLPTLVPFLVVNTLVFALSAMNYLWAIRALYAVFTFQRGWLYKGDWVAYGVVVLVLCVSQSHAAFVLWTVLGLVNLFEQLHLTVRALRQRKRGAGQVAAGYAGGVLSALAYFAVTYLTKNPSGLLVNALSVLCFILPALGISLFLAREFALDAELLKVKLDEVERLSAQTLAQEQDKQTLLAQQNEMLETRVQQRTGELQRSLTDLRATQAQLIQKEKMASLGELTAGIAHEIQNPLNFVNNFSEVSTELCQEAQELLAATHLPAPEKDELTDLLTDMGQNQVKITEHGRRAAGIVRGMLEHSRTSTGERAPTDVNALCDEYLRLAYHGLRAKDKTFNAALQTDFAPSLPLVEGVGADLGRVLLNLFNNAFYAVQQRQRANGEVGYLPTVSVRTKQVGDKVEILVADNGTGMPAEVQAKIFQPFFTTKPTGEGTGLGLSLAHDIIAQGHGGTLSVDSEHGQGTTFTICLPVSTI